jgi:hypothetical protein
LTDQQKDIMTGAVKKDCIQILTNLLFDLKKVFNHPSLIDKCEKDF